MNVKPDVATNLDGEQVGQALADYWQWLVDERRSAPEFAIATAYFNPGGFEQLAAQLEAAGRVRLLLGAEPDAQQDLARVRPLGRRHPSQAAGEQLRVRLSDHHRQMAQDRDLQGFSAAADARLERMLSWLRSGKVEVRRLESRFLHGKAYLVESDVEGVLVGSSNFTGAGLTSNVELNLARYDTQPVMQVKGWFDRLWDEAVEFDLAGLYEQRFQVFDPYVVYLRMLWEQYHADLDEAEPSPHELDLTMFQKDGLYRAMNYLERHNGVLIADGVGLGKTYVAGELIRQATYDRRQRVLLISPAALRDGPWKQFLHEHRIGGVDRLSFEELAADPQLGGTGKQHLSFAPREYAMVVIDEAHNYRNPDADRTRVLRRLLAGSPPKQLVLLTATPVNNSLWDLYHLLSLFIRNDGHFLDVGIDSLRRHFAEAERMDPDALSPDVLFDVLDAVAVRRTRRFVKRFYPDEVIRRESGDIPITFPRSQLHRVDYNFDAKLPGFFEEFAHALGVDPGDEDNPLPGPDEFFYDPQRRLTLARYAPSAFLIEEDPEAYELQAAGLLRSGLLKRFESSPYAFARTCAKMARSHETFLDALDEGWVLTGDALAAFEKSDTDEFDPAYIAGGGRREPADRFNLADLRAAVEQDRQLLRYFQSRAETIDNTDDPKLQALVDELAAIAAQAHAEGGTEQQERDRRKVLIFSYYADTVEWIAEHLRHATIHDDRIAVYTDRIDTVTGSGDKQTSLWGFAPISAQAPSGTADRFDILVTTDVLAEGVNLQQGRHIINFDLPWNPMRMVQRHGRIDRIGSVHDRVYLRSFFPSQKLNSLLGLERAIHRKLTQAAKTIGVEDDIIPGLDTHVERIYGATDEQVRRLYDNDASLLDDAEPAGALSGEEFRRELATRLDDPRYRKQVETLPWVAGTGKTTTGQPGFVFCAHVGDHLRPVFRNVPVLPDGTPDLDGITGDVLPCLALARCEPDTPVVVPDNVRQVAYNAWEAARTHIFDAWDYQTDPANLAAPIPKPLRDAADLLRSNPTGLNIDRLHRYIDTIEAPYDTRTQRAFRHVLDQDLNDRDKAAELIALIDDYGLQPPPPTEPLPEIDPQDIHLVTWMALVNETQPMNAARPFVGTTQYAQRDDATPKPN